MKLPIIDTHCDLLSYLAAIPGARADNIDDIACAVPLLRQGNVKMQILAIYTNVSADSMEFATLQATKYRQLLNDFSEELYAPDAEQVVQLDKQTKIAVVSAIENAAGLANENTSITKAFEQFDQLSVMTGSIAYISLTHHTENRFGGGNYTEGKG